MKGARQQANERTKEQAGNSSSFIPFSVRATDRIEKAKEENRQKTTYAGDVDRRDGDGGWLTACGGEGGGGGVS